MPTLLRVAAVETRPVVFSGYFCRLEANSFFVQTDSPFESKEEEKGGVGGSSWKQDGWKMLKAYEIKKRLVPSMQLMLYLSHNDPPKDGFIRERLHWI